jgi:hypothetical protein
MPDLTLNQLLKISFLPNDVKKEAIEKLPLMTDDQKFQIEQICWENLRDWYQLRFQEEKEKMLTEMAQEIADYKPEDFEQAKDRILNELLVKIEEVKTNDELAKMKDVLKTNLQVKSAAVPQTGGKQKPL